MWWTVLAGEPVVVFNRSKVEKSPQVARIFHLEAPVEPVRPCRLACRGCPGPCEDLGAGRVLVGQVDVGFDDHAAHFGDWHVDGRMVRMLVVGGRNQ